VSLQGFTEVSGAGMTIHSGLARGSFLLYLFFALFGTTLPFREQVQDVDDIVTSNIINQVVFGVLLLVSAATLVKKRHQVALLVRKERYLTLFLLWCFLSVGWSDYGLVSFKRIVQILTAVSAGLAVLMYVGRTEEVVNYIFYLLAAYIVLSLASVAAVPGATDPEAGGWRGLASQKNTLGQIAFIGVVVFSSRAGRGPLRSRVLSVLLAFLSLILLAGSRSMTSLLALALLATLVALSACDDRFRTLGLGRSFSLAVLATVLGAALSVWWFAPDMIDRLPTHIGRDITLTGRTDMWADLFRESRKHLLAGCGFGGFWVMENPVLLAFYRDYPFLPRQAHLGYLDILNEIGLVGLLLFCLIVLHYFRNLGRYGTPRIWTWLLVSGLVVNFTETVLFRQNILMGVLFILAYLALFTDIVKDIERDRGVRAEVMAPVHAVGARRSADRAVSERDPPERRPPRRPAFPSK
jgi:exopolysaccharide production protein ExoQ